MEGGAEAHGPGVQEAEGEESGIAAGDKEARVGTAAGVGRRNGESERDGDGADSGGR